MTFPAIARLGFLALTIVSASGCDYRLAGANRSLPPGIHTIAVPAFENRTDQPEIGERITERLLEELIRRGRYRTQSALDGADAVLEGTVTSYITQPVEFTPRGKASRIEVTVQARVQLTELSTRTVVWSQDNFVFRGRYDVPEGVKTFFDREAVAIDQIARDFSRTVVTSLVEGF